MILPNKFIKEQEALIGVGALLLQQLNDETLLTDLWEKVRESSGVENFERFILGLDLLYLMGAIDVKGSKIIKVPS